MTNVNASLPPRASWPAWMLIAEKEIGTREVAGTRDSFRIKEYQAATHLPAKALRDETPWCACFVSWCLEQAGEPNPKFALARNYLTYGVSVIIPRFGDIAVFSRGEASGHVGFFVRDIGADYELLGGNQNNSVRFSHYPASRLLGFRRVQSAVQHV